MGENGEYAILFQSSENSSKVLVLPQILTGKLNIYVVEFILRGVKVNVEK